MAIYQGDEKIVDRYVGETLVTRAYQGDELIFDAYSELSDTLPLTVRSRASQVLKNYRIYGASGSTNILPPQTDTSVWDTVGYIKDNGGIREDQNYRTTTFLDATEGTLSFTNTSPDSSWYRFGWYDENQSWLSETSGYSDTATVTPPASAVYMRISINTASDISFVTDGTPTPDNPVEVTGLGVRTENLFDKKAKNAANGYVDNSYLTIRGNISISSKYYISEYIGISESSTITFSGATLPETYCCFYDDNKTITGTYDGIQVTRVPATFNVPRNAKYIRLSVIKTIESLVCLTLGSTAPDSYIPYGYKLPLTVRTGNLFDKDAIDTTKGYVSNRYLSSENEVVAHSGFIISEYIDVSGNAYIYLSSVNGNSTNPSVCFYDLDFNFISGEAYNKRVSLSVTVPATAVYCRFSCLKAEVGSCMLTKGSTPPETYIPYYNTETPIYIGDSQLMAEEYVDYAEQKVYKRTENLFNKNTITPNSFLKPTGEIAPINGFDISDFIPVENGDYLVYNARGGIVGPCHCIYDEYKNFVRSVYANAYSDQSITISDGEKYIRISLNSPRRDKTVVKKGSTAPSSYIPYLQPTDPPVLFSDITLPQGTVTIDIEGNLKPQAAVKGRINPTA